MYTADIFLEADPNYANEILEYTLHVAEITNITFGQGSREISIEARFKDYDELFTFLHPTLPELPGIKVTGYTLVPRFVRNIDEWFPPRIDFGINKDRQE